MIPNLTEQIIQQNAYVQQIYADLTDLIILNAVYPTGQLIFYNDTGTGLVGAVIGDGFTNFVGLINILAPATGGLIPTNFTYNTVPTGIIIGSYTPTMLSRHGLCPSVTIRFEAINWPNMICQFDDNDNPTAFTIDLGRVPSTKTYVKFI